MSIVIFLVLQRHRHLGRVFCNRSGKRTTFANCRSRVGHSTLNSVSNSRSAGQLLRFSFFFYLFFIFLFTHYILVSQVHTYLLDLHIMAGDLSNLQRTFLRRSPHLNILIKLQQMGLISNIYYRNQISNI